MPIGLFHVIRRRRAERVGLLVFWWILAGPLPAALTRLDGSGHCLRAVGGLPAYQILAAIGAEQLFTAALRRSASTYRAVVTFIAVALFAGAANFSYRFFVLYPPVAAPICQTEWIDVFRDVRDRQTAYDAVFLTAEGGSNQLGTLYLFWTGLEPRAYFQLPRGFTPAGPVEKLTQLGTIGFLPTRAIVQMLDKLPPGQKALVAVRPDARISGVRLRDFCDANGRAWLVLYEVQSAGTLLGPR